MMHLKISKQRIIFLLFIELANILKLWGKEKEAQEKLSAVIPSCVVCNEVVL